MKEQQLQQLLAEPRRRRREHRRAGRRPGRCFSEGAPRAKGEEREVERVNCSGRETVVRYRLGAATRRDESAGGRDEDEDEDEMAQQGGRSDGVSSTLQSESDSSSAAAAIHGCPDSRRCLTLNPRYRHAADLQNKVEGKDDSADFVPTPDSV